MPEKWMLSVKYQSAVTLRTAHVHEMRDRLRVTQSAISPQHCLIGHWSFIITIYQLCCVCSMTIDLLKDRIAERMLFFPTGVSVSVRVVCQGISASLLG